MAQMLGGGWYNNYSAMQKRSSAVAVNLLEEATRSVIEEDSSSTQQSPFVVVDYGSSEGGNSIVPMSTVVRVVRQLVPQRPITVIHNDRPTNDFTQLFKTVSDPEKGYSHVSDRVFFMGVGRSFYEQIIPDSSVHLGFAATAFHWMSRAGVPDQPEDEISQGAQDWRTLMDLRARELAPGGTLVMILPAETEEVDPTTSTFKRKGAYGRNVWRILCKHLRELHDERLISHEEYRSMLHFPTFARTEREVREYFNSSNAPIRLTSLEMVAIPCPYFEQFAASVSGDNRSEAEISQAATVYAQNFERSIRSWTEMMLINNCIKANPETRNRENVKPLIEELYRRFRTTIEQNPRSWEGHFTTLQFAILVKKPAN